MVKRKLSGILVVGLALAGKNCGAVEVADPPGRLSPAMLPKNRTKKNKGKSSMTKRGKVPPQNIGKAAMAKNQNIPPGPQRTVDEIIHAAIEENGAIYSRPSATIFDGSGGEALDEELKRSMKEIIAQVKRGKNVENLDGWLEVIDQHIGNLAQIISVAYFELPDYTPKQVENHNRYYGLAKKWFESLKKVIQNKAILRARAGGLRGR
ncbi:MAG: hypothetical protein LBR92_03940 [Puniceicoccales bacterium]|jgi:hypothetical protein|nr:hypothetical protein [Puniceicoccales bacterium]